MGAVGGIAGEQSYVEVHAGATHTDVGMRGGLNECLELFDRDDLGTLRGYVVLPH